MPPPQEAAQPGSTSLPRREPVPPPEEAVSLDNVLSANPVVPVVVVDSVHDGVEVGKALVAGGISTAEVTLRTAAGVEALAAMHDTEGLTVGAGTVLTSAQAEQAIEAGARYVVSPGFSEAVVRCCQEARVPVLPGCADSSWIMAALELGVDTVKFFPASTSGGVAGIKALSAAFPGVGFVPTGGVSTQNLGDYLALECVRACGGSWMVRKDLVARGQWEEISHLSAQAVAVARGCGR